MPAVLALFAHPDDIEFTASGTLLQLARRGWDLHYCNLSSGNMGSTVTPPARTARIRRAEAHKSAQILGATWHPPFCHDLQIFYTDENIRRVCAVIRAVQPTILLTHPSEDYMEDHMVTCKLAVTGAFTRGIPFYKSKPNRPSTLAPVTIYHGMPRGHETPDRKPVQPDAYVNTAPVHARRREALAAHRSQKEWLDATQGVGSFLDLLDPFPRKTLPQIHPRRGLAPPLPHRLLRTQRRPPPLRPRHGLVRRPPQLQVNTAPPRFFQGDQTPLPHHENPRPPPLRTPPPQLCRARG